MQPEDLLQLDRFRRALLVASLVLASACADDAGSGGTNTSSGGTNTSSGGTNAVAGSSGAPTASLGGAAGAAGATPVAGTSAGGSAPTAGAAGDAGWLIDNTTAIHGLTPMLLGAPTVTETEHGPTLCFDGDDGVVLDQNPLEGLAAFTLEVLFRPDAVTPAEAALSQPRFVHIETADAARATIEARVNETELYLDTYLLAAGQSLTLIDETKTHPVGVWYWAALSYADGQMRHYMEGVEDAAGSVTIPPLGPGKVSIGVRQNLIYWFKGCVRELRVAPRALAATELRHVR